MPTASAESQDPPERESRLWDILSFRYLLLTLILVQLGFVVYQLMHIPEHYPYDRYGNLVIGVMGLLVHLAFFYKFPRTVELTLKVLATGMICFAAYYVFHLSKVWFPLPR